MKKKIQGIASILFATIIWGGAFVAQSTGMDLVGPFTFQAVRCGLAVVALAGFLALLEWKNLKDYFKKWADPKLWKAGIFCGAALFVATSLQQFGLIYTDAGKAGFLTAMYIVIVPLFGLLLRKKPSFMAVISIGVAVAGMYFLCCTSASGINIGDILLIGCAIAFAAQITLVDRFAGDLDSFRLNAVQALVVSLMSAVAMFLVETPDFQSILQCWLPLSYAGVLSMGFGYSMQIIGQKRIETTTASLLMSLESVFAVIFGAILLKETMTFQETLGCILVFTAVILSQIPVPEKKKVH